MAVLRDLTGKTVLITGAGRGIGKRLAIGLSTAGARLGLLARSQAELDLARLEIEHAGGVAISLRSDVRDYAHLSAAVDELRSHFGPIHALIAAAGLQGPVGPLCEVDPRKWADTVETNLVGVMHACRAVLSEMVARRSGKIVVLTGGGATKPRPNFSAYAASKAALARFVETLAEEVRDHNIQVNCMSPGGTYTHMTDQILQAGEKAGDKDLDDARQVRLTGGTAPERQIQLAMFLISQKSNHVSGKIVHVKDDWQRLEQSNVHPEIYTLRRVQKLNS